jgi:hypothetical protein
VQQHLAPHAGSFFLPMCLTCLLPPCPPALLMPACPALPQKVKTYILETIASDPGLQQTELVFLGLFGRACRVLEAAVPQVIERGRGGKGVAAVPAAHTILGLRQLTCIAASSLLLHLIYASSASHLCPPPAVPLLVPPPSAGARGCAQGVRLPG